MKKLVSCILSVLLCLTLIACDEESEAPEVREGEAKTPSSSSVMQGSDLDYVQNKFSENGFTNIKTQPIPDIVLGWKVDDGEVEKVSVGGNEDYESNTWVPNDTEVIIYYHTYPVEIVMPYDNDYYENDELNLEELKQHFEDLGFCYFEITTSSDPLYQYDLIDIVRIDNGWTGFDEGDIFMSSDVVEIRYHTDPPNLTIENCPDLNAFLIGEGMSYMEFAEKYDGQYIEIDAFVSYYDSYMGNTSHVVSVRPGDADSDNENAPSISVNVDVLFDKYVFPDLDEGRNVKLIGTVNAYKSEYFKELRIDAIYYDYR